MIPKTEVLVSGLEVSELLSDLTPFHEPEALHDMALAETHDKTTSEPLATVIGPLELLALMSTVGGCTGSEIFTKVAQIGTILSAPPLG